MPRIVLCTYSHAPGDGIARMDSSLLNGLSEQFSLSCFVLRPDFPSGHAERHEGKEHIALLDAPDKLGEALAGADVLQVNGPFDPVAVNAAVAAGVPVIIEVLHQVESGGLHPATDLVVGVSGLAGSVQRDKPCLVIPNGIDTDLFAFRPGRRDQEHVLAVQVANTAKRLHHDLSDLAALVNDPRLKAFCAGSRPARPHTTPLGVLEDMPGLFRNMDLVVGLERETAFGLVFAEGMACGCLPVIARGMGAEAFVRHGRTGWIVDPADRENMRAVLLEALNTVEKPRWRTMQAQARRYAEERLSLDRMLRQYENLYLALRERKDGKRDPVPFPAWTRLQMFLLLNHHHNPEAPFFLEAFLADGRALESYFLLHPIGASCVEESLRLAPLFVQRGQADLLRKYCARLRESRCISPLLDEAERLAAG